VFWLTDWYSKIDYINLKFKNWNNYSLSNNANLILWKLWVFFIPKNINSNQAIITMKVSNVFNKNAYSICFKIINLKHLKCKFCEN